MRINLGLPGPFSVSGKAPKGTGTAVVLGFLAMFVCCCGGVFLQNLLELMASGRTIQ